jgi:hypothetical protein
VSSLGGPESRLGLAPSLRKLRLREPVGLIAGYPQPKPEVVNRSLVGVVRALVGVDDLDVLFAVVALPVAHGTRARVSSFGAHAVAGRAAPETAVREPSMSDSALRFCRWHILTPKA